MTKFMTAALTALALAAIAPHAMRLALAFCQMLEPAPSRRPVLTPIPPPVPARRTLTGHQACRLEL